MVERLDCSLPILGEPVFLMGSPVPESKRPDGGFDRYIVTSEGLAEFGAYLASVFHWVESARICLEAK